MANSIEKMGIVDLIFLVVAIIISSTITYQIGKWGSKKLGLSLQ